MATHLFPAENIKNGHQKRSGYAVILSDIVRGCSDAIDALTLFDDLHHERPSSPTSAGFMYFDAHGGDTGCQLRAGMIQDFWLSQKDISMDRNNGSVRSPSWLLSTVEDLKQPKGLGLGTKQDTPAGILLALGWSEMSVESPLLSDNARRMIEGLDSLSVASAPGRSALAQGGSTSGIKVSTIESKISIGSSASDPDSASTRASSIASTNDIKEPSWMLTTQWDMHNPGSMIRFLVYAYTLSKYKSFCRLDDVIGARLDPDAADKYGKSLMEPYLNDRNVEYKSAKVQRIVQEFRAMQSWLSDHSCAWIKSLTARSSNAIDMSGVLSQMVQKSPKGLKGIACYPAYLLQREHWAQTGITMMLIDRHFCAHGWHYNVFEAKLETPFETAYRHPHASGLKVTWTVTPTSIDRLIHCDDKTTPHLAVMGNSIAGSYDSYMRRIPILSNEIPPGSTSHDDAECHENSLHVEKFENADHDRLTLSFFADHDLYAFPLESGGDEQDFVEKCFDDEHDYEARLEFLKTSWKESRREAEELGAGKRSIHTFGWQHMFTDTFPRLGARLALWQERGDLMPLSAGCANI